MRLELKSSDESLSLKEKTDELVVTAPVELYEKENLKWLSYKAVKMRETTINETLF
jgi:hypothetical protein